MVGKITSGNKKKMKNAIEEFPLQTLFTPILNKCQFDLVTLSSYT